jgi:3-phosphoshikimate 1-carboxyvinyltransferase
MTAWSSTLAEALQVRPGQVKPGIVRGRLRVPPSKSVSHRQLALALLARSPVEVRNLLRAEDIDLFLAALRAMGWTVEERAERDDAGDGSRTVRLAPGSPPGEATLECGNAGTLMRFPGGAGRDGAGCMDARRHGAPPRAAGRAAGRRAAGAGRGGDMARPRGLSAAHRRRHTFRGGETTIDAGESSQYLSALLLAALGAQQPTRVRVTALTSAPYVDVTLQLIARWGGRVEASAGSFVVTPGLRHPLVDVDVDVEVEGDFSAAAYPAAAAALTGGEVTLRGLRRDSAQGDREFLEVLRRMGAEVSWRGDELQVAGGGALTAVDVDMGSMPDQVPTLAALAPFARGTTAIRNVPHLRIKESDRLAAMARELGRAGAVVEERADGLVIPGVWADVALAELPRTPVSVDPHGDHRIAMSMALVGLRRPGLRIAHPEVVAKSYPRFWDDLATLRTGDAP